MYKERAFTLLLYSPGANKPIGTGFLVHSDGLVLTCYHVVRDALKRQTSFAGSKIHFTLVPDESSSDVAEDNAKTVRGHLIVTENCVQEDDMALLQIEGDIPAGMIPVPLVSSDKLRMMNLPFHITGFSKIDDPGHHYEYMTVFGVLGGRSGRNDQTVLVLDCKRLQRGMSGGAVYVPDLGGVVGMLSARYTPDREKGTWLEHTGWAIRSEHLASLDKRLIVNEPKVTPKTALAENITVDTMQIITVSEVDLQPRWERPRDTDPGHRWRNALERHHHLEAIAARIAPDSANQLITLALRGMSGMGKSTLAALYVHHYGARYRGGVLWAHLGPDFDSEKDTQRIFKDWVAWGYGGPGALIPSLFQGKIIEPKAVRRLLTTNDGLEMLVVLDDIQDVDSAEIFLNALPDEASILLTTSNADVAKYYNEYLVEAFDPEEALAFLQMPARKNVATLPRPLLTELALYLGNHPYALAVVADHLDRGLRSEIEAQRLIKGSTKGNIFEQFPDHSLKLAFMSSYKGLSDDSMRTRLRALGIFAPGASISTNMIARVWGTDTDLTEDTLIEFRVRSLIIYNDDGRWSLHTLMRAFLLSLLHDHHEFDAIETLYQDTIVTWIVDERHHEIYRTDLTHVQWVTGRLLDEIEGALQYTADTLAIDTLATVNIAKTSLNPDFLSHLERRLSFIAITFLQTMTLPEARTMSKRCAAAIFMGAATLSDDDIVCLGVYYFARWHLIWNMSNTAALVFKRAVTLAREAGQDKLVVYALGGYGTSLRTLGETEGAFAAFQDMAEWIDEHDITDDELRVTALAQVSAACLDTGRISDAETILREIEPLIDRIESTDIVIYLKQQIGTVHFNRGNAEAATLYFDEALEGAMQLGDQRMIAEVMNSRGLSILLNGTPDEAIAAFQEAHDAAERIGYMRVIPASLANIAFVNLGRGDTASALLHLEDALRLLVDFPDANVEAYVRTLTGKAYLLNGANDKALMMLHEALPLIGKSQNTIVGVELFNAFGQAFQNTGRIEEGFAFFEKELPLIERLNNAGAQVTILSWMMLLLNQAQQIDEVRKYFVRAQSIIDQINNPFERAIALLLTASVYRLMGEWDHARADMRQAAALWSEVRNDEYHAIVVLLLIELDLAQHQTAVEVSPFGEIETYVEGQGDTLLHALYCNTRGKVSLFLGDDRLAESYLKQARLINGQLNNKSIELTNQMAFAQLARFRSAFELAQEYYTSASENANEPGSEIVFASIRAAQGDLTAVQGDRLHGAALIREAVDQLTGLGIRFALNGEDIEALRAKAERLGAQTRADQARELFIRLMDAGSLHDLRFIARTHMPLLLDPAMIAVITSTENAAPDRASARATAAWLVLLKRLSAHDNAFEVDGLAPELLWWCAAQARQHRNYREALNLLNNAIEKAPDEADFWVERAWVLRGLDEVAAARRDLERVAILQPADNRVSQGLGVLSLEAGDASSALEYLTHALLLTPNDAESLIWRSAANESLGNFQAALKDVDGAIEANSGKTNYRYWRALALLDIGERKSAKTELDMLINESQAGSALSHYVHMWRLVIALLNDDTDTAEVIRQHIRTEIVSDDIHFLLALINNQASGMTADSPIREHHTTLSTSHHYAIQRHSDRIYRLFNLSFG